ncbi:MAG TPA: fibronectin type III domain-containing protein [Phycisphaerales bacterium]|nr:fibronectin type III domain-containing protein [Phycisphaerales bacterium]
MGTIPTSPRADFLQWCQAHVNTFITQAANIGLTEDQANAFSAAVTAANTSNNAANLAKLNAESANANNSEKFADLRRSASEMVRSIRTFAENEDNPNVYVLANVPPPVDPSTAPPPAKPTELAVELNSSSGAVMLSWKASNPVGTQGTSYIVRRRTSPTAEFQFVGVTGLKKFTDNTFFAGPDSVQYTVQGQRADSAGPVSDIFTINFGRVGGGLTIQSVNAGGEGGQAAGQQPKLAA